MARALERVERAQHSATALVEHMRVDHRRLHVGMTEQFLHRADVVARLQEVCCKRVAQHMRRAGLVDASAPRSDRDRALNAVLVQVMPAHDA